MKKLLAGIISTAVILSVGTTGALAVSNGRLQKNRTYQSTTCTSTSFVDTDNDGICDNKATRPQDGTGNKNGNNNCTGSFVDTDNDGICDNKATRPQDGTGNKNGNKNNNCTGDGVCKNNDGTQQRNRSNKN